MHINIQSKRPLFWDTVVGWHRVLLKRVHCRTASINAVVLYLLCPPTAIDSVSQSRAFVFQSDAPGVYSSILFVCLFVFLCERAVPCGGRCEHGDASQGHPGILRGGHHRDLPKGSKKRHPRVSGRSHRWYVTCT